MDYPVYLALGYLVLVAYIARTLFMSIRLPGAVGVLLAGWAWSTFAQDDIIAARADLQTLAFFLVLLMLLTPLSGCFGQQDDGFGSTDDVVITPAVLTGGVFQGFTVAAEADLSVYVPYLMLNSDTGFVQNSTVIDLKAGESALLTVLAPPRTDTAVIMLGEYGREHWPVRTIEESWRTWIQRDGNERSDNPGVERRGIGPQDAFRFSAQSDHELFLVQQD